MTFTLPWTRTARAIMISHFGYLHKCTSTFILLFCLACMEQKRDKSSKLGLTKEAKNTSTLKPTEKN